MNTKYQLTINKSNYALTLKECKCRMLSLKTEIEGMVENGVSVYISPEELLKKIKSVVNAYNVLRLSTNNKIKPGLEVWNCFNNLLKDISNVTGLNFQDAISFTVEVDDISNDVRYSDDKNIVYIEVITPDGRTGILYTLNVHLINNSNASEDSKHLHSLNKKFKMFEKLCAEIETHGDNLVLIPNLNIVFELDI